MLYYVVQPMLNNNDTVYNKIGKINNILKTVQKNSIIN